MEERMAKYKKLLDDCVRALKGELTGLKHELDLLRRDTHEGKAKRS